MNAPQTQGTFNPGMDKETFEQFAEQLDRYVRERLIPAEGELVANDKIPDEIVEEMREMGIWYWERDNTSIYTQIFTEEIYTTPTIWTVSTETVLWYRLQRTCRDHQGFQ